MNKHLIPLVLFASLPAVGSQSGARSPASAPAVSAAAGGVPLAALADPLSTGGSGRALAVSSSSSSGPPATNFLDARFVNDNMGEVDSADIADGSLTGADVSTSSGDVNFNGAVVTASQGIFGLGALASAPTATVSGGLSNTASSFASTVSGGSSNSASGNYATVSGGIFHSASGSGATVSGGYFNSASGSGATVSGGYFNSALAYYATVSGGLANSALADYATVSGGMFNSVSGTGSVVGSGRFNEVASPDGTVAGGHNNKIFGTGPGNTIGGGKNNIVTGSGYSVVSGGRNNTATRGFTATYAGATVGGGSGNQATNLAATVGGGENNVASGHNATVGGGSGNQATYLAATVGGGENNLASGYNATVPGGTSNAARGHNTFAAGKRAKANHGGAFVWGDGSNVDKTSSTSDEFNVYASGGTRIFSNSAATSGVLLAPGGGSWTSVSDRNAKENFEAVDGREILARVVGIPITTWNYKAQDDGIRHMGPMAQDFWSAFGLGLGEKSIDTIDPDGIALAAIQGLNETLLEQRGQIEAHRADALVQREEIDSLRARVLELEAIQSDVAALKAVLAVRPAPH